MAGDLLDSMKFFDHCGWVERNKAAVAVFVNLNWLLYGDLYRLTKKVCCSRELVVCKVFLSRDPRECRKMATNMLATASGMA